MTLSIDRPLLADDQAVVTEPGIYDMPDHIYHGDPVPGGSLSSSGAKMLLSPSCPAKFRWRMDNPQPYSSKFALGHAAHLLVLGAGPALKVIDANDWRTKKAREDRDEAHAAGLVPLLVAEHDQVQAMAAAIRQHPVASVLFNPDHGRPEQSLFWMDDATEVWRRARFDWLPNNISSAGRLIVPDYKTTEHADLDAVRKSIYNFGYHQQAAWYVDAANALLGPTNGTAFLFVFQEKTPPYLIRVVEPDVIALRHGRNRNREAIETYAQCIATGRWPGYSDDIEHVALPAWVENQIKESW